MKKNKILIFKSFINKHHSLILLLIIFLVAAFFRFYKISVIPFGLNNDSAWEGSAALNIINGDISNYIPYASEGWRGEGIIRLTVVIFMQVFGNDPITIKLASAVFGVSLIIPLFFLIKNLFNLRYAALTTFFIAISGWHITMSRSGWRAITVPFFATLLFYFYFKGIKTNKILYFVLTGIMLSISTFYTYDAGRVTFIFFVFWLFISFIKTKDFIKIFKKHLSFTFISFILFSLPMIYYALFNWDNFIGRSSFLFIGEQIQKSGSIMPLVNNVITAFLTFNLSANGNDFFIYRPLVDVPVSFLIPIGFILCLWNIYKRKNIYYLFMFLWFLFNMIPGILSSPNGNREVGTIPAVYFFAAIGLYFILDLFNKLGALKENFKKLLIVSFLFLSSFVSYYLYLGPERLELPGFYPETLITTNYIKTIWDDYDIYITDNYPRELLTYYLYKNKNRDAFEKSYIWTKNSLAFLDIVQYTKEHIASTPESNAINILGVSDTKPKGLAFFMFPNNFNEMTSEQLLKSYPNAKKLYLYYKDDNINRPASLVILIPGK